MTEEDNEEYICLINEEEQYEYISFALGLPANEALPLGLLQDSAKYCTDNSLQYSPPVRELKSQIKELVKQRAINCKEEEIFITAGAQQGISLLTKLLHDKFRSIITEELVYPGFLQIAQSLESDLLTIASNYQTGIDLDILEQKLKVSREKPSLIYSVVDGNNPMSFSLALNNRQRLVSIAKKYQIPILEDDPYGFLCYQKEQLPALKALEPDHVCYIGSFSKIIAPALRVGWLIVPKHIVAKLSMLKESSDIDTATFSQHIVSRFIGNGHLDDHLTKIKDLYRTKRDLMINCIKKYLPSNSKYIIPQNDIFLWLELDSSINADHLFKQALKQKVMIMLGSAFIANNYVRNKIAINCIRLNFSFSSYEEIEAGMKRIGNLLVFNDSSK